MKTVEFHGSIIHPFESIGEMQIASLEGMNIWEQMAIRDSSLLRSSQPAVCHLRPVPCNKRSDSVVSSLHGLALSQGWQIMIHCSLWHYCKRTNDSYDWISQWWRRTLYDCCESNRPNWTNRVSHSIIHHTRLFLCDHRGWSRQITGHSYHSRRIGIDICMVFIPIISIPHWSSYSESTAITLRLHTCF